MLRLTKPLFRDSVGDGYDPVTPYQMIPQLGRRYMMLQTGRLSAELKVVKASCGLTNFRVVRPFGQVVPTLPDSSKTTQTVVVPANIEVQFDMTSGIHAGVGSLEIRELHGTLKSSAPDIEILIEVRERTARNFQVCYVFDPIHPDQGVRLSIDAAFDQAKKIFLEQANIIILKTGAPVTVTLTGGAMGAEFDAAKRDLVRRLLETTKLRHGNGIFQSNTSVIYIFPVPVLGSVDDDDPTKRVRPLAISVPYKMDGERCETILVAPPASSDDAAELGRILAHEIGHTLGLEHLPMRETDAFPNGMPKAQRDAKSDAEVWLHNLMFPSNFVKSNRLNFTQIARCSVGRPDRPHITV